MSAKDGAMDSAEMVRMCKAHTMYSWSRGDAVSPIPIARSEGACFFTPEGKRYLDFNSQVMSVNIGHSDPRVIAAMKAQLDTLPFAMPGAATAVRARVGALLAELLPDPINTFFFTNGGAEANENAVKAARWYTGRFKIISRYRSYHGATNAAMQLTGDLRRWYSEPGAPGFIHVLDPTPYDYRFGRTDAEITQNHLAYLEEVIAMEGPDQIAAFFMETVTGTNGVLPPPEGYLPRLRELLDRHGILLVCDEVMVGFGRTGKLFAFEHYGVVPDIVTMAKGLTSSYAPLGAMGVSDAIAAHFQTHVFWGGLTYYAHPLSLAAAEASIQVLLSDGLVARSAELGVIMAERMEALARRHPSVRAVRALGLFGMVDLQRDAAGTPLAAYGESHPAVKAFKQALLDAGVYVYCRWSSFMCLPPLCVTEAELREGFDAIDEALALTDAAMTA